MVWYTPPSASARTPLREEARDLGRGLELDQRAEAVADHLAEQAALRARERRLATPCAESRASTRAFSGGSFSSAFQSKRASCAAAAGAPAKQPRHAPLELAGEHDLLALGVEHHAARGAQQRHAGGDVVLVHAVHRHAWPRRRPRRCAPGGRRCSASRCSARAPPRATRRRDAAPTRRWRTRTRPRRAGAARDRR